MTATDGKRVKLLACDEVPEGGVVLANCAGLPPLAVYNLDGEYFVTNDLCTHGDASLADGDVLPNGEVECPFHQGTFDIRTGAARRYPCTVNLKTYPVTVIDGEVWIETETADSAA